MTLQVGFRQTNLTLADGTAVYTDTGSLSFTILDDRDEVLLYPPHQFEFEFFDGTIWAPLLPEPFNLTSG
ncbi:MAG: hypothetical protein GWN39_06190, partial [Thermoplasmata archaeon]|nr:hypothetical protein [Thermoplasmata archaeon]